MDSRFRSLIALAIIASQALALPPRSLGAEFRVDCDSRLGLIRPLHGVNGGPLCRGETLDLSKHWKELAIPSTRLHDCEWPGGTVVDMHAVFPLATADPAAAESYRFAKTDDYLQAAAASGGSIVYRLGESIEHSKRKHYVHPPADNERWAAAALGIIRHYNEGWAGGFRHNIRYWEIWNEPENRPQMWTGSDQQYFALYVTAAKTIKAKFPSLKIGGPAVGAPGEVVDGRFQPSAFVSGFLKACQNEQAPLDFFSFHAYSDDPRIFLVKAQAIRRWLDEQGFRNCELHLNEWNYLPDNDWGPLALAGQGTMRQRWFERQTGSEGAAFVAQAFIGFQDSPIDVANFYRGDAGDFGLFNAHGAANKTFYAFKACRLLLDTPERVKVTNLDAGKSAACAGLNKDRTELTVLLSNYRSSDSDFSLTIHSLPWTGATSVKMFKLDASRDLENVSTKQFDSAPPTLMCKLPAPAVMLIKLKRD